MSLAELKKLIQDKISTYRQRIEWTQNKEKIDGDIEPIVIAQSMMLVRIEELEWVLKEIEKLELLRVHTHDSGDGSCPACEAQGVSKEFLLKRMKETD